MKHVYSKYNNLGCSGHGDIDASGQTIVATSTREEDKAHQELPRSHSVLSKVVLYKKFIKAMEKMKKSKPKDQHYLPRQPGSTAENVHLRAQRMDKKNCKDWCHFFGLQQVIGKLSPTQKKKVSMLVEAFERVNPLPDSTRHQRLIVVA